ncbi:MAG: MBL fold metallo-hydrolase [Bryobacterales bacterium]|nr:MBL fold metallo-hydrolase [Bryobacterales bacterium]
MPSGFSIEVLGSGTSTGVPTIGCGCRVCTSEDPRDRRLRPSILVRFEAGGMERSVVIDTGPDFRQQALSAGLTRLDAILYTHDHADHIMGLDDVRPFNYWRRDRIPVYASESTLKSLMRVFPYGFKGESRHAGGVPRLDGRTVRKDQVIEVVGKRFEPFTVHHGPKRILGFRFGRAAYVTDQTGIPAESLERLENLDVLFLGALRHEPHPMHSTVAEALAWVERLRPKRTFLTHMCHMLSHEETDRQLPAGVSLAYDGLKIAVAE